MEETKKPNLMYFTIAFILIGAGIAGLGLNLEWCKVDAEEVQYGPIDVNLTAEFTSYSVNYEGDAKLNQSRAPSLLGLAGGLTQGKRTEIEDEKMFLTGMGDFQENIGVFYDSTKTVTYETTASRWNGTEYNEITVEITTNVDMIPWWVEGVGQPCEITVTLLELDENVKVNINRIWLELQLDWDENERDYTRTKVLWQKNVNNDLNNVGDFKKYEMDATLDEDYGRVGLVGKANVTITDTETQNTIRPLERKALTINIYTLSQTEGVDIVLMVLAFPIAIVSIILTVIAVILILLKNRVGSYIAISAFILMLLVVIFYFRGMTTLLSQIDIVQDYFEWSYGIVVTAIGAGSMTVGGIMAVIIRPPKAPKKSGGAGKGRGKAKGEELQFVITEKEQKVKPSEIKEGKVIRKARIKPIKRELKTFKK